MKKSVLAVILGWFVCSLLNAQLAADHQQKAQQVFEWVREAQGDSIWENSSPTVQKAISPQDLNGVWKSLTRQFGPVV